MKRKREYQESRRPSQYRRVTAPTTQMVLYRPPRRVAGEMKYFDCDFADTAITDVTTTWPAGTITDPTTTINLGAAAVATPLCLFAPTVGSGLNQRIGRSVKVMKIKMRGRISYPAVGSGAYVACQGQNIRIMLVQDCQTNAAQMTAAQLMQDSVSTDCAFYGYQNPNNFGRFKVLKDKIISTGDPNWVGEVSGNTTGRNGKKYHFKFSVRFRVPIEVHFNATNGGTVADIVDHSFHIICGADQVSASSNATFLYYSRVSYKE